MVCGAGGARTHDRRIMRSQARRAECATCTDTTKAGDEDSVFPIRHFYQRWGAAIAIERRPSVAARLHAAERALADPDPAVRDQAVREAAEIVQAAYREVAGG